MLSFHLSKKSINVILVFLVPIGASLSSSGANRQPHSSELLGPDAQATVPAVQQPDKASPPDEVARQFYGWYLSAGLPNPERSNMANFRKYVTQSFLKRATSRNVDSILFVAAQDTDETWAKNFTVSKATMHGPRATVEVALKGKEMNDNLHVTLRREGGVWKIDDVKGTDR